VKVRHVFAREVHLDGSVERGATRGVERGRLREDLARGRMTRYEDALPNVSSERAILRARDILFYFPRNRCFVSYVYSVMLCTFVC
jgi:hypothetical protein